ncbi:carboxymuconolactone decarboxylase family protein [Ezakiella coagulans]|uniref:carboxymuconolactone decarboxylase family protein n=1 Tax=Ezakiella coagulans TaxID=46507 RepID=UPI002889179F|nr:carboxymuconolactone decarboxylase family protein [Ezakiella coagulans]
MTKRILSLALAVVMAATTFSFSAFAADKKEEKKAEKQEISLFEKYNKNVYDAFKNAAKANKGDSALTQKQKEFISLAVGIAVKCDACTKTHSKLAVKAGATMEELAEMVGVCVMMGGGPSTAFGRVALETAKEAGAKEAEKKIELKPITEFKGELSKDIVSANKPEFAKKYALIGKNVMQDGYLTVKEKELISLAIAISVRCDGCMKYHGAQCARVGVTEAELADLVACCKIMGGGPASPASRTAIKVYQEEKAVMEKEAKEAKEAKTEKKAETKTEKKTK